VGLAKGGIKRLELEAKDGAYQVTEQKGAQAPPWPRGRPGALGARASCQLPASRHRLPSPPGCTPGQPLPPTMPPTPAGEQQEKLAKVSGEVSCLRMAASGDYLAVAFAEGGFKVYEWPSMKLKVEAEAGSISRCARSGRAGLPARRPQQPATLRHPSPAWPAHAHAPPRRPTSRPRRVGAPPSRPHARTPSRPAARRSEASAEDSSAPKAADTVKDFDFSPLHQDKLMALTTSNGVLELWDVPAGKLFSSMRMQRSSTFNTANCVQVQDSRGVTIEKPQQGGGRALGRGWCCWCWCCWCWPLAAGRWPLAARLPGCWPLPGCLG
jgi:hypothetical protein